MGDLSLNFSKWEFKCSHCGRRVGPSSALIGILQRARTEKGRPLHIVSGYRCAAFNKTVGGVKNSEHLTGNAADVISNYGTVEEWTHWGAGGIGVGDAGVIHVDCRPGWHGHVFRE
jgi:uncharacterized protein YcbK (DUF882 family)